MEITKLAKEARLALDALSASERSVVLQQSVRTAFGALSADDKERVQRLRRRLEEIPGVGENASFEILAAIGQALEG